MRLLLDTSAFLWFLTADERLSTGASAAIRSPDNDAWLSAASFWEIMVKHQLGRLPLPEPPSTYIPRQRKRHGIASLAIREKALTHLPKLPTLHKDPFDRILVCQSLEHGLILVTSDPLVQAYPVKTLW
jgi:PIN domain nuclease of toxin-antitoxin system